MENNKTFIMCHRQDVIIDSLEKRKYESIGDYKFLFLGHGDTSGIENNDKVIICKNLLKNIEKNKNCLQYCGWYACYNNNLVGDSKYVRFIDYDIDILNFDIKTNKKVKGTIGFDFDFYFKDGFGDHVKFNNDVVKLCGKDIDTLIHDYNKKYGTTKWFSSIDTLMCVDFFKNFMEWFKNYYNNNKDNFYFGMHFERFLMVYCLITEIECEITQDETKHHQLKSHIYY